MLIQLGSQLNLKWYEFGLAVGISQEILENCLSYPPEVCVVEILDNWLTTSKPTWKDVAMGLIAIGLQSLADDIMKVYETGKHSQVHAQLRYNTLHVMH